MDSSPGSLGTLATLAIFIAASVWLGTLAHRIVSKGAFLKGYFLGNRDLGSWALALTATVQSGGTFMGFPSLVYSYGWIVILWIAGYMAVPLTGFAILGKRLAQISRRTGAITVPDLFRERFSSPAVGLTASLLIIFYMAFMMVAQFKAGALVMKLSLPGTGIFSLAEDAEGGLDRAYYLGLAVFTLTVVGYTLIGGFLAAVWTDIFQSVMMLIGILILLPLSLSMASGLQQATLTAAANTGPGFVFGPGYGPGGQQFLPVTLAVSFFAVWVFAGLGSPASMVRVMACRNSRTIRRSIFMLNSYNLFIYIPLVMICICARAVMPDLAASDEVIPRMALLTTKELWGGSFLAGLILAAPFGAVMATVSCYLVVIASGLVRDVYQRFLNPTATDDQLRRMSHVVTVLVGAIAVGANIHPVKYLQAIVVFSGTSAAATFVIPGVMACYWRRSTAAGTLAAMLAGTGTMLGLFGLGWTSAWFADHATLAPMFESLSAALGNDPKLGISSAFRPFYLLGMDPLLWGLLASLLAGVFVSLSTQPPSPELVSRMFDAEGSEPEMS